VAALLRLTAAQAAERDDRRAPSGDRRRGGAPCALARAPKAKAKKIPAVRRDKKLEGFSLRATSVKGRRLPKHQLEHANISANSAVVAA
jgi:hypothetical protein